ncbi:MAG TPA: DUF6069 family protein [Candidatus Limnocylindrales bacterium]|nr:DUF6069 family protein [Candidatus Limnocylindrales bacterium]
MSTTDKRPTSQPTGRRVLAAGLFAATLSTAINLAIRALVLGLLDNPEVPYPLVLRPVIEFTFLPSLFGTLLFLFLRRVTTRPVHWFTIAAAAVLVLSWIAPVVLFVHDDITAGVLVALMIMHTTPAVLLVTTLRTITRTAATATPPPRTDDKQQHTAQ